MRPRHPQPSKPLTFMGQETRSLPPGYDTKLPTPPPPCPCDYGCPRFRQCKVSKECCRTYRTYESSGMRYFADWDTHLMKGMLPLAGRRLRKTDQEYST